MNVLLYTKTIPPLFQEMLGKLKKVYLHSIDSSIIPPSSMTHYLPTKDGLHIYTSQVIKLSHELAHMVEVSDNNRLIQPDYGMKTYFPSTRTGQLQAVAREARARGIQTRLIEKAYGNCQMLAHRTADALIQPPGQAGKFKDGQEIIGWSAGITMTAYEYWDINKIMKAWDEKAKILNDWMNSSS